MRSGLIFMIFDWLEICCSQLKRYQSGCDQASELKHAYYYSKLYLFQTDTVEQIRRSKWWERIYLFNLKQIGKEKQKVSNVS